MKSISGKEFCKVLEKKDWRLARINGSHYIYTKQNTSYRISVLVHKNNALKIGLLKSLMKLASISDDEL